jgi:hypothetical protein
MSLKKFESLQPPVDHDDPCKYAWPTDDVLKRMYAVARNEAADSLHWKNQECAIFLEISNNAFRQIKRNLRAGKVITKGRGGSVWSHELMVKLQEEVDDLVKENMTPTDAEMTTHVLNVWRKSIVEKVRKRYLKIFFCQECF